MQQVELNNRQQSFEKDISKKITEFETNLCAKVNIEDIHSISERVVHLAVPDITSTILEKVKEKITANVCSSETLKAAFSGTNEKQGVDKLKVEGMKMHYNRLK